jgi:hypothetical protein
MSFWTAVVAIVAILVFGRALGRRERRGLTLAADDVDALALRDEVATLRQRVATLERIATEPAQMLSHDIDRLRLPPETRP